MRAAVRWLVHTFPPGALAVGAVAGVVVVASALSTLAERSGDTGSLRPETPTLTAATTSSPSPTASPTFTPIMSATVGGNTALSVEPEAGSIIFQTATGVWRYDARVGWVSRIGDSGRPTTDGTQFIIRHDGDPQFYLADAASGNTAVLAPRSASDVDWIGAGHPMAFVDASGLTVYVGLHQLSVPLARARFVRLSPDGARAAVGIGADIRPPGPAIVNELVEVEIPSAKARTLVQLGDGLGGPTLAPASWSPDGRYFAYLVETTSASLNADGIGLRVADALDASVTDLGITTPGTAQLAWAAPHTLAYVAGGGRATWRNKTLRLWSPEKGSHDLTGAGEIGLHPSWSADGETLFYISARSAAEDPIAFFAARASGARHAVAYDVRTGNTRLVALPDFEVTEGLRPARAGPLMLRVARPIVVFPSISRDMDAVPLLITTYDAVTHRAVALVRIASQGMGLYGSYTGPEQMAWSR